MITDWRKQWGQGDFPFYFVQLANYMAKDTAPGESGWAELREAQSMTLKLPNTGQAVIIDVGESDDIHPRDKATVGERLARIALAKDYGKKDVVYSGPTYQSMKVDGSKVRLAFDHVGGGLVAKELRRPTRRSPLRTKPLRSCATARRANWKVSPSAATIKNGSGLTPRSKAMKSSSGPTRCPTPLRCVMPGRTTRPATSITKRACLPHRSAR